MKRVRKDKMLVVQNDFAKQTMDRIWDEYKTKHGKGTGRPIPRTRKKNIEKAIKKGSEVKNND